MRSIPSTASIACSSSAKLRRGCAQVAAVGVDVLAEQRDLADAVGAPAAATSATSSSSGRLTSRPRVDGTMQYEQAQLQPTLICIQPWNSRVRFIGRWPVKPSNSK